jgi:hypothetical protein
MPGQHVRLAQLGVEAGPAPEDVEALIRRLRLRCRRPIHFGEARDRGPRWAHHQAVVWDPATRIQGIAWSDRSADAALAEAFDAFLVNAGLERRPPAALGVGLDRERRASAASVTKGELS